MDQVLDGLVRWKSLETHQVILAYTAGDNPGQSPMDAVAANDGSEGLEYPGTSRFLW